MLFGVFSQGGMYSPASVSAADSSAVQELAHSLKARVGMAAEMLDTGETVAVGDEADYPMQSVVKFVLALSVLKRVDQGVMNLEQIIRIRPEQLVKDTWSPLRERFPQGGDFLSEGTAEGDCPGKRQQYLRPPVWPYWEGPQASAEGFEGMGY